MEKLYQEGLKAHYTNPNGLNREIDSTHSFEGYNATCGDEIIFFLKVNSESEQIEDISFKNDSCAICTASASILCESIKGVSKKQFHESYAQLLLLLDQTILDQALLDQASLTQPLSKETENTIKALNYLSPVKEHPSRINCALLPWQTVSSAFENAVDKNSALNSAIEGSVNA